MPFGPATNLALAVTSLTTLVPLGLTIEQALEVTDVESAEKKLKALVPLGVSPFEAVQVTSAAQIRTKLFRADEDAAKVPLPTFDSSTVEVVTWLIARTNLSLEDLMQLMLNGVTWSDLSDPKSSGLTDAGKAKIRQLVKEGNPTEPRSC